MIKRISRRGFLAASGAAASLGIATAARKNVPVGLELFSVRDELAKDDMGTVRAVAKMGYQVVEFFAPYYNWTPDHAREMRKLMDDLGIRCLSTHNDGQNYTADKVGKTVELNHILGARYVVMASAGRVTGLDGWKKVAGQLADASEKLKPEGLRAGYHNHQTEFQMVEGKRPMEVLAAGTPKDVILQLDVGTCVNAGSDPVAWIKANPGRIRSIHCKDWAPGPDKEYRVLFGEGVSPWKAIFKAAESVGGVEYYLIEQEGSRFPPMETAQRCIDTWKKLKT
jgi:sugar phosphate isomerase/epimerase